MINITLHWLKLPIMFIVACCIMSCATGTDVNCGGVFAISPEFNAQEKLAIIKGMNRVNSFTKHKTIINGDYCHTVNIASIEDHSGTFSYETGNVSIDIEEIKMYKGYYLWIEKVAAHEFLHSVGLEHVEHGLMAPVITVDTDFSEEDYLECKRVKVCD